MVACATCKTPGEIFNFNDVSAQLGIAITTVRAWHRTISRPLRDIDAEFPNPPFFEKLAWDYEAWRRPFRMHPLIADAILAHE